MGLLGKLFSKKEDPPVRESDNYSHETQEAVRKWVSRFAQWSDTESDFWSYVAEFRAKNGFPPKVNDAIWAVLNKQRMLAATNHQFGMYSNLTRGMYGLLIREGKQKDALKCSIELITFDASGLSTSSWRPDKGLVVDPTLCFVAPAAISDLAQCAVSLSFSVDDLKEAFLRESAQCLARMGSIRPDTTPEKMWDMIAGDVATLFAQSDGKVKQSKARIKEPVLEPIK